jgi:hypothetical protein
MEIDFSTLFQIITSLFILLLGYNLQKTDYRRKKHDNQMAQYLFNLTNCLVVTVDSVAEIASELSAVKNIDDVTTAIKDLKSARRELATFQQKLAADHIVRGRNE